MRRKAGTNVREYSSSNRKPAPSCSTTFPPDIPWFASKLQTGVVTRNICHIIVNSTFTESLSPRRRVTGIKFRYIRSRYKYSAETDVDDKRERRWPRTMYQTAVNPIRVSTMRLFADGTQWDATLEPRRDGSRRDGSVSHCLG
ncbi:unnamed protein product [Xylocopa violacea]|uniref:Uncharacterized protein n=1 Tax=Xylocopa violacea TaxID=135666 RepID=A0ABP1NQV8_XYLVO